MTGKEAIQTEFHEATPFREREESRGLVARLDYIMTEILGENPDEQSWKEILKKSSQKLRSDVEWVKDEGNRADDRPIRDFSNMLSSSKEDKKGDADLLKFKIFTLSGADDKLAKVFLEKLGVDVNLSKGKADQTDETTRERVRVLAKVFLEKLGVDVDLSKGKADQTDETTRERAIVWLKQSTNLGDDVSVDIYLNSDFTWHFYLNVKGETATDLLRSPLPETPEVFRESVEWKEMLEGSPEEFAAILNMRGESSKAELMKYAAKYYLFFKGLSGDSVEEIVDSLSNALEVNKLLLEKVIERAELITLGLEDNDASAVFFVMKGNLNNQEKLRLLNEIILATNKKLNYKPDLPQIPPLPQARNSK